MPARIFVDLQFVHPVIDDIWHRANLRVVPTPGEDVQMLCGVTEQVEIHDMRERRAYPGLKQCESCEAEYRRQNHIAPFPRKPSPWPSSHTT